MTEKTGPTFPIRLDEEADQMEEVRRINNERLGLDCALRVAMDLARERYAEIGKRSGRWWNQLLERPAPGGGR